MDGLNPASGGHDDPEPFRSMPLATPQGPPATGAFALPRTPASNPGGFIPFAFESDSDDDHGDSDVYGELPSANAVPAPPPPRTLEEAWRSASGSQTNCTPPSKNLRNPRTKQTGGRKIMESELGIFKGKKVKEVSVEYARALYEDIATDEDINSFLRDCKLYNRTRKKWVNLWKHVDRADTTGGDLKEESLYDDMRDIIAAVLKYFERKRPQHAPTGTTREIVDTHKSRFAHDNGKSQSLPDFAIKATGPSFERPGIGPGDDLGYKNVASVFDVKVGKKKGSANEQAKQLGVYNMYVSLSLLISQPLIDHTNHAGRSSFSSLIETSPSL